MPDRDVETIRDLIDRLREDKITVLDIDSIVQKPRIC